MSLFKEKDDFITNAFKNQFNQNSDDEDSLDIPTKVDKVESLKLEEDLIKNEQNAERIDKAENSDSECIEIESDDDDCEQKLERPPIQIIIDKKRKIVPDPEVITLDSDEEDCLELAHNASYLSNQSHNSSHTPPRVSQDSDDHEFNLKLMLAGAYKEFPTTYKTKLSDALKVLLNDLVSKGKRLIINMDGKTISLEESPSSLQLKRGTILDAIEAIDPSIIVRNPDEVSVKLQDGNRRHTKEYRIGKTDKMLKLKQRYAKEFEIQDLTTIKLLFDGDVVDDDSTAEELDIDDGDAIDVIIS